MYHCEEKCIFNIATQHSFTDHLYALYGPFNIIFLISCNREKLEQKVSLQRRNIEFLISLKYLNKLLFLTKSLVKSCLEGCKHKRKVKTVTHKILLISDIKKLQTKSRLQDCLQLLLCSKVSDGQEMLSRISKEMSRTLSKFLIRQLRQDYDV